MSRFLILFAILNTYGGLLTPTLSHSQVSLCSTAPDIESINAFHIEAAYRQLLERGLKTLSTRDFEDRDQAYLTRLMTAVEAYRYVKWLTRSTQENKASHPALNAEFSIEDAERFLREATTSATPDAPLFDLKSILEFRMDSSRYFPFHLDRQTVCYNGAFDNTFHAVFEKRRNCQSGSHLLSTVIRLNRSEASLNELNLVGIFRTANGVAHQTLGFMAEDQNGDYYLYEIESTQAGDSFSFLGPAKDLKGTIRVLRERDVIKFHAFEDYMTDPLAELKSAVKDAAEEYGITHWEENEASIAKLTETSSPDSDKKGSVMGFGNALPKELMKDIELEKVTGNSTSFIFPDELKTLKTSEITSRISGVQSQVAIQDEKSEAQDANNSKDPAPMAIDYRQEALSFLRDALNSKNDPWAQVQAGKLLWLAIKDDSVKPIMEEILTTERRINVRLQAAIVLAIAGEQNGFNFLFDLARGTIKSEDPWKRTEANAFRILIELGAPFTEEEILKRLQDEIPWSEAGELSYLAAAQFASSPMIVDKLEDHSFGDVLNPKSKPYLDFGSSNVSTSCINAAISLLKMGRHREIILSRLKEIVAEGTHPYGSRIAARVLGQFGDETCVDVLKTAFEKRQPEHYDYLAISSALVSLGDHSTEDYLIGVLKNDFNGRGHDGWAWRQSAATILGRMKSKKAVDVMLELIPRYGNTNLGQAIMYALAQIGEPSAIPVLYDMIAEDKNGAAVAAYAILQLTHPSKEIK